MFNGINNNQFECKSDMFTQYQDYSTGTGSLLDTISCKENLQNLGYGLFNDKSEQKSALKNLSNDNFFDYLNNVSDSTLPNVSKLSEEKLDLSSILKDIHLDSDFKNTDDNGSDKENEIGSLSLADLFFKGKKESSEVVCAETEINNDSLFEDFMKGGLSLSDDQKLHNHSEDSAFFQLNSVPNCTKDHDLSSLFNDLLCEKEPQENEKTLEEYDCDNFVVDLNLAQKGLHKREENSFSFLNCELNQQNSLLLDKFTIPVDELPKAKESLFCKVLCSKVKKSNGKTVPRHPSDLPSLLSNFDYFKYFAFDTPSPDDLIKDKQKYAFQKQ